MSILNATNIKIDSGNNQEGWWGYSTNTEGMIDGYGGSMGVKYASVISFTTPSNSTQSVSSLILYLSSYSVDYDTNCLYAISSRETYKNYYLYGTNTDADSYQVTKGSLNFKESFYEDKTTFLKIDVSLKANTTYYLYLWGSNAGIYLNPATRQIIKVVFGDEKFSYIDNSETFEIYSCYIDTGSVWEPYTPYIDNGTAFEAYG